MSTDNKDDVIAQIQRIMRLYNRAGTEGEKAAADAAMKRLARIHGIDLEEIKANDADIKSEAILDEKFMNCPVMEMGYITSVLRQHFGIIMIQHRIGRNVKLEWVGTRLNVAIAKHVAIILLRAVTKDWAQARMVKRFAKELKGQPGYHDPKKQNQLVELASVKKRAFMDGWFWTIHQKLTEHPIRNDREQFEAEKKSAEDLLNKMKEEQNIQDRRDKEEDGKHGRMDDEDRRAIMMGYKAAKSLNLSRPCEGRGYAGSPLALS